MRSSTFTGLCAAAALLAGCENGLLHQPAPADPASLTVQYSVQGGAPEAFDKVNRLSYSFVAGGQVRAQEEFAFSPSNEAQIPISVPLRELSESFTLNVELRRDAAAIFRGSAPVTLGPGRPAVVDLALTPVVARVVCAGPRVEFASYGQSQAISGAALFATEDTIFTQAITFSGGGNVVSLAAAPPRSVNVTAVADGETQIQCTAGQASDTRAVRVFAVVAAVQVTPPTADIPVGSSQQFAATLRDARGNAITGRTVTWSSSNPAIATVSQTGVVSGVATGTARIDATNTVTGSANVTITAPPPTVTTLAATDVGGISAVLNGSASPNGIATQGWFQLSTSPTLAGAVSTPAQNLGSGSAALPYSASVGDLSPATTYYYRAVASNAGGQVQGAIQSFQTLSPGPPIAVTTGAFVTPNSDYLVVFQGEVTPMGSPTTVFFEYGTSPDSLFSRAPSEGTVSAGAGWFGVAVNASDFTSAVDIYFRVVAFNQYGRTNGATLVLPAQQVFKPVTPVPPTAGGTDQGK